MKTNRPEGYLVEYTDGGKPSDPRHTGYISWSPKEQFDKAYAERPAIDGLLSHQQRVVDELAELDDKMGKLWEFFQGPVFASLPQEERQDMEAQYTYMGLYSDTLQARINRFQS